jgi:hypothetical protein
LSSQKWPEKKRAKGSIYYFTGDKYGNYEAVAYFEGDKTIDFVVLTSQTEEAFKPALKPFEKLALSYVAVPDGSGTEKS